MTTPLNKEANLGNPKELYDILKLRYDCTQDGIKKAYRQLAFKYHPNRNPNNLAATEMFKEINYAHSILSDAKTKEIYDRYGQTGLQVANQFGEDNVNAYLFISYTKIMPRCKFVSCGLVMLQYFGRNRFCSCNFCCRQYKLESFLNRDSRDYESSSDSDSWCESLLEDDEVNYDFSNLRLSFHKDKH
ncbi:DgyrCDS9535 [Dimorphilus gyrociliatus]|uniref:DgyrCDS9535 n=1 Tax=Dimorphilus gyrociliatus TaxID=2664684 RepID=A0A7I8VXA3_9ANNE|nr:DgyrCDS9535 [Dimorphilus gyrociliatus]